MAWERRGRGLYYYRSVRRGKSVSKIYFGRGPAAEAAANEDAEKRVARAVARQAGLQGDSSPALLADLNYQVEGLIRAALTAAGFHQHKRGEWRRRRRNGQESETAS